MGIIVTVRNDFARLRAELDRLAREQLPFGAARALTDTAKDVQAEVTRELPSIFDRPTPFTQRGIAIKAARKSDLTAIVFVKDVQAGYLALEETGGTRNPAGRALVVPVDIKRDRFGGIPRGVLKRLKGRGKADVFVGKVKGVGGFWQRGPFHSIRLLAAFRARTTYRPRFAYHDRVAAVVARVFPERLRARVAEALASARR